MATAVVVLNRHQDLEALRRNLLELSPPLRCLHAVGAGETPFEQVEQLNPQLRQQQLQRTMALWLAPFGFFAGVTFTFMTNLRTFAVFGDVGNHLMGGLLGMVSGLLGSFAARAGGESSNDDRLRQLRNRSDEGCWLLIVETATGNDMPWKQLHAVKPQAVMAL